MTATEVSTDRLAMNPAMVGARRATSYERYDDPTDGIWCDHGYEWCSATAPDRRGACSRPRGHSPHIAHVAATSDAILAVWGGVPDNGDIHRLVDTTVQTKDVANYDDPVTGIFSRQLAGGYVWCRAQHEGTHFLCSRPHGHDPTWQHIAANTTSVVATWGGSGGVDKWGHIKVGDRVTYHDGWDSRESGDWLYRAGDPCNHRVAEFGDMCRRKPGHTGQHVIADGGGYVMWVGGGSSTNSLNPDALQDPEDGSPLDEDDIVYTALPEVGELIRLRDRKNRMYVMGQRPVKQQVEVLDLLRNEVRAIPMDRCVKSESVLSPDELGEVVKWYSEYRKKVRKIAVREYRNDRWCMAGLNQNLGSLGLERYEPTLRGKITVSLPFEWPDSQAGQGVIEEKVRLALGAPEVAAALRLALPPIDGMELEPENLKVSATDFQRK